MKRLIGAWLLALATAVHPQEISFELASLSLEELMDIEVFSVSKKEVKLSESAAAIFVVTQEDMRRAGATSIPEALRLVPGMEVARADASKWAVSARGFNDIFANKLLVLIDGRSVYSPLFSGVFWDAQDLLLEDVERIEVICGPGATLWGANAVNGIINILTKNARDTQGGLITAGLGSEERNLGSARYGSRLGDALHYRVYARRLQRDDLVFSSGERAADAWEVCRGGFRLDWEMSERDALMLQGDIYDAEIGTTFQIVDSPKPPYRRSFDFDTPISGGDLLGRWMREYSETSNLVLQAYYDRSERGEAPISGYLETFDFDFQHSFGLDLNQEIIWGLGYRSIRDGMEGSFTSSFDPSSRTYSLFSAFVQEEISLAADRVRLTLGSKFEHNDFTGFEVQPSFRLLWMPAENHTGWAAVSRAVRTPSRSDRDIRSAFEVILPGQMGLDSPTFVTLHGDRGFQSENVIAFELGYRAQLDARFFLDLATFYSIYDDLLTVEPGLPFPAPDSDPLYFVAPAIIGNRMSGSTYGAELAVDLQVRKNWRLRATHTCLNIDIDLDEGSAYLSGLEWEGVSPRHQLSLRSLLDLPCGLEFDLWGRYVGALPDIDLDGYFGFDARLGWKLSDRLEFSIVGQNLLEARHAEFRAPHGPTLNTDVQRGAYGVFRWRFEPGR